MLLGADVCGAGYAKRGCDGRVFPASQHIREFRVLCVDVGKPCRDREVPCRGGLPVEAEKRVPAYGCSHWNDTYVFISKRR